MPKFFYTVIMTVIASWLAVLFIGSGSSPTNTSSILTFLFSLFIALGLTFTALTFVYLSRRASLFMNRHILFRRSFKYGFFTGFFMVGSLTLSAFDLATTVNFVLFLLLCLALYKQFRGSRV